MLEMIKVTEIKILPPIARIHRQKHINKTARFNMKARKYIYF